jgi:hypothetical protein
MSAGIERPRFADCLYASVAMVSGPSGIMGSAFLWAYLPSGAARIVVVGSVLRQSADQIPSLVLDELNRLSGLIQIRYTVLGALVENQQMSVLCAKSGLESHLLTSEIVPMKLSTLCLRAVAYADQIRVTREAYEQARPQGIDAILDMTAMDENDPTLRAFLYGILAGFVSETMEYPRPPITEEVGRFRAG